MKLKNGSEGHQDLSVGEEGGAGAERRFCGFVALLFSYNSCLGLTHTHA